MGGLYRSFEILGDNPRLGRQYDQHWRRYIYRGHQVFYRLLADRILIVDIRNARQSPPE